jgi:hypothetical protein
MKIMFYILVQPLYCWPVSPQLVPASSSSSTVDSSSPTKPSPTSAPNSPQDFPDIFISLRFVEALEEAKALKTALTVFGLNVFLCAVDPGDAIDQAIITALENCRLVVIMATRTYGRATGFPCSTHEELKYIVGHKKPFFLVKMCDEYEEAYAKFNLPVQTMHFPWQPATAAERNRVPPQLVVDIINKLGTIPERNRPVSASSSGSGAKMQHHA